jgi:hypothetical protein
MIAGCNRCSFLEACGGVDGALDLFGCHQASPETCRKNGWICPICDLTTYTKRWAAVKARADPTHPPLAASCELPPYVPRIDHAGHWSGVLPADVVAMPTSRIVGGRGRSFGPKYRSRSQLLRHFHLRRTAHVFLISVAEDPYLEQYWGWGRRTRTPERLASLGIAGITIPNFSFFSDAHRYHLLYNRARLAACLSELSGAGVPVIPHVHALTIGDRLYWIDWLRDNPQVRYVCREFQTGNGEKELEELAEIRDVVGRELHPLIVGGARFARRLRELFTRSTIVDATPFIKAQNGQCAVARDGRVEWRPQYASSRRARGALLRHNIHIYEDFIAKSPSPASQMSMLDVFEQALRARQAARDRAASVDGGFVQRPFVYDQGDVVIASIRSGQDRKGREDPGHR